VRDLYLDTLGKSLNGSVYTKEVISEVNITGENIYKSFISDMDSLASAGTIKAWKPLPYDWRLSLSDIVDNGALQKDGTIQNMIAEIEKLVVSSQTGKVSIVTHSKGGLVAKYLVKSLEAQGKAGIIDKLIMVAAPQLGTPKSIPDMLHGTQFGKGFVMSQKTSRGLSLNMPGAYQLLPTREYFNKVATPVIQLDQSLVGYNNFINSFGNQIADYPTLKRFLLDTTDNRTSDPDSTVDDILTLSPNLMRNADTLHSSIDSYVFPGNIGVSSIVGWGLDTIAGVTYYAKDIYTCLINICSIKQKLAFKPVKVLEGDETVVSKSAVASMPYYINLSAHNKATNSQVNHSNILFATTTRGIVINLIKDISVNSPYVSNVEPVPDANDTRTRISVHSPVAIHVYDSAGRHTGLIANKNPTSDLRLYEAKIPNSYYEEYGDDKYVGFSNTLPVTVKIQGTGTGTFTLNVEEVKAGVVIKKTSYAEIPVIPNTKAEIVVSATSTTALLVDHNGDGINDFTLSPGETFNATSYLESLRSIVRSFKLRPREESAIMARIGGTIRMIKVGMIKNPEQRIATYLGGLGYDASGAQSTVGLTPATVTSLLVYVSGVQFKKL